MQRRIYHIHIYTFTFVTLFTCGFDAAHRIYIKPTIISAYPTRDTYLHKSVKRVRTYYNAAANCASFLSATRAQTTTHRHMQCTNTADNRIIH